MFAVFLLEKLSLNETSAFQKYCMLLLVLQKKECLVFVRLQLFFFCEFNKYCMFSVFAVCILETIFFLLVFFLS